MHNAGALLPELVDAGIRLLIYAGEADISKCLPRQLDIACSLSLRSSLVLIGPVVNFIGCSRMVENLATSYSVDYAKAPVNNFTSSTGEVAGWTKATGEGAGNVAFVSFRNAGHMVGTLIILSGRSRSILACMGRRDWRGRTVFCSLRRASLRWAEG
jgi:cathepsin A (carboxypeptidase C)